MTEASTPNVDEPDLREELLEMQEEDERLREVLEGEHDASDIEEAREADRRHAERLAEIIDELGEWPGDAIVGRDGSRAAWLIAHHADHDPELQDRCLELLEEAVEQNKASPQHYARLFDRIRVNRNEKQRYGTQFHIEDGEIELEPLEERDGLDERRDKMRLQPLDAAHERIRAGMTELEPEEIEAPELRRELIEMRDEDQRLREELEPGEISEEMLEMNQKHTRRLAEIIDELGQWPGYSLVGRDGSDAAWTLVQHAEHEPDFQEYCLELLEDAVDRDEANARNYAYLFDRLRISRGDEQRYGTQLVVDDGEVEPEPLEDPETLDERRREMGLRPLDVYIEEFREIYDVE